MQLESSLQAEYNIIYFLRGFVAVSFFLRLLIFATAFSGNTTTLTIYQLNCFINIKIVLTISSLIFDFFENFLIGNGESFGVINCQRS